MAGLHYDWFGPEHGPVVVLLHGANVTGLSSFYRIIPLLVRKGFRVLSYDRAGNGKSIPNRPERFTWEDDYHQNDARDLVDLLDIVGVKEPCTLIANSDGCIIGLLTAAIAPHRIGGVILCGGTHVWSLDHKDQTREDYLSLRTLFNNHFGSESTLEKLKDFHGSVDVAKRIVDRWLEWWIAGPQGEEPRAVGWDLRDWLPKVHCPVLGIAGVLDFDSDHGPDHLKEVMALLPYATDTIIFEECGHFPQHDNPEEIVRLCANFISKNRLARL